MYLPYFAHIKNERIDGNIYRFTVLNINNSQLLKDELSLQSESICDYYALLCSCGNKITTKVRKLTMFQYGATIGPAQFPKFVNPMTYRDSMLPRPVVKSRPNNCGYLLLRNFQWIKKLSMIVMKATFDHLNEDQTEYSLSLLKCIDFSIKNIPSCLRICDTFFTQMILVGDPNADHGEIPIHTDNDDYITALVSIGTNNIRSGHTNYYETRKKNSYMLSHSVEFKNLNIQIGNFDKVYH